MEGKPLEGIRVAILATDGFEQVELTEPKKALEEVGATTKIISPHSGELQGFQHHDKGDAFSVDMTLDQAKASDFDAVHLPGGVINGDEIRIDPNAQKFVREMDSTGKPISVICHGGWLLISAGLAAGRKVTSWPTLQDDFRNAGAEWVDEEVVIDRHWTSSRKPDDIPAFNRAMINQFEWVKSR
jgi:protease I